MAAPTRREHNRKIKSQVSRDIRGRIDGGANGRINKKNHAAVVCIKNRPCSQSLNSDFVAARIPEYLIRFMLLYRVYFCFFFTTENSVSHRERFISIYIYV